MGILEVVVSIVAAVVTPFLVILARKAVKYLEQKMGVEFSREEEDRITALIAEAVSYAEQVAKLAAKTGQRLTWSEKQRHATDFVAREAARRDLAKLNTERAVDLIESHLGALGRPQ